MGIQESSSDQTRREQIDREVDRLIRAILRGTPNELETVMSERSRTGAKTDDSPTFNEMLPSVIARLRAHSSGPAERPAFGDQTTPDSFDQDVRSPRSDTQTETRPEPHQRAGKSIIERISDAGNLTSSPHDDAVPSGSRIQYFGDYELIDVIGRGGMGVVYRARQISLNRPVAVKMIRGGLLSDDADLRRFLNEAEAVAALDHPRIVPVYETGEHEGQHYFSMKLIHGCPLSERVREYQGRHRDNAQLIAEVAEAVHHAHLRGILHRDLKPANILIDEQEHPHVTDFGLAKRIERDSGITQSGAILGTPSFMAPEQASGIKSSITTATDVYGLGAVLYSLLAGKAPFGGDSLVETLEAVRNRQPEAPSRFRSDLPRDLEIICLKCLGKDPKSRYSSAKALADDLRRWISGEPILARPVSRSKRFLMWCRRNPVPTSLAAALSLAVLGGLAGTTWKWREAELGKAELINANQIILSERNTAMTARDQARDETSKADAVITFLVDDILQQASPEYNPRDRKVTVEDALDLASGRVGERFKDQPEVEVRIRDMIGRTYLALGSYEKSQTQLSRALEIGRETSPNSIAFFEVVNDLATLYQERGKLADAERLFRECHEGVERLLGPNGEKTLTAKNNLAVLLEYAGRRDETERLFREIIEVRQRILKTDHPATLKTMMNLASVLSERAGYKEAETLCLHVIEGQTKDLGKEHPDTLESLNILARIYSRSDQPDKAVPIFRKLLEINRRVQGAEHINTLIIMNNLAIDLRTLNQLDEAEALIRECLEIRMRTLGPLHSHTIAAQNILASLLQDRGKFTEAEPIFRSIHETMAGAYGDQHPDTLTVGNNFALCLYLLDREEEAERLLKRITEVSARVRGATHPSTLNAMTNRANVLKERGDLDQAAALARTAFTESGKVQGEGSVLQQRAARSLCLILLDQGNFTEAELIVRKVFFPESSSKPKPKTSGIIDIILGSCLAHRGKDQEAEKLLTDGYKALRANPGSPPQWTHIALNQLIEYHASRNQTKVADELRLHRLDLKFPPLPFAEP